MKTIFISRTVQEATLSLLLILGALPVAVEVSNPTPCQAKEFSIGIQDEAKLVPAKILEAPAPQIPAKKQEEAFKTSCEARFVIDPSGKPAVTLTTTSGSDEIDEIALRTLKRWKFHPATLEGKAVASTRRIKIEFEVE